MADRYVPFKLKLGSIIADLDEPNIQCSFHFIPKNMNNPLYISLNESELSMLLNFLTSECKITSRPTFKLKYISQKIISVQNDSAIIRILCYHKRRKTLIKLQKVYPLTDKPYELVRDEETADFLFSLRDNLSHLSSFLDGLSGHV